MSNEDKRQYKKAELPYAMFLKQVHPRLDIDAKEYVVREMVRFRPDLELIKMDEPLTVDDELVQELISWGDEFWPDSEYVEEICERLSYTVTQYYHGNFPGWRIRFQQVKNLLDVMEHEMDSAPSMIVLDNEDQSRGTVITVYSGVAFAYDTISVDAFCNIGRPVMRFNTGMGEVFKDSTVMTKGARWATCDDWVSDTIFTTLARWRWPEVQVYTWFYHGDEDLILAKPDQFNLDLDH